MYKLNRKVRSDMSCGKGKTIADYSKFAMYADRSETPKASLVFKNVDRTHESTSTTGSRVSKSGIHGFGMIDTVCYIFRLVCTRLHEPTSQYY